MLNLEETLVMREESLAGVLESHFFLSTEQKLKIWIFKVNKEVRLIVFVFFPAK